MPAHTPTSNADADWSAFDPDAYFEHYYGEPHADDDLVAKRAAAALHDFAGARRDLDVVDVGTGANLIPLLAALPVAATLTAWEYAESNIRWLQAEVQRPMLRPQWQRFWSQMTAAHDTADCDISARLRAITRAQQGSIFDLPSQQWDAATMFFCAESITHLPEEFERACACFAGAVKPGGALVAAFLARSQGYEVAGISYPAVPVNPQRISDIFAPLTRNISVSLIGDHVQDVRSGYTGMVFLSAIAA